MRAGWGARESAILTDQPSIHSHTGPGNWVSVSEHVGNKSPDSCKQHYFQTYIDVDSFPFPMVAPELINLSEVC